MWIILLLGACSPLEVTDRGAEHDNTTRLVQPQEKNKAVLKESRQDLSQPAKVREGTLQEVHLSSVLKGEGCSRTGRGLLKLLFYR